MSKAYSRKTLQSAAATSEYCLTDFKTFKVMPKINAGEAALSICMLEMSSLNRQMLEEFHRRYLLSFVHVPPSLR
jgi:hypothetical protein